MVSKKELLLPYCLAVILLVVGVVCYAGFPAEKPEEPVRLMFKCVAGKVLFDHKTHTADSGYGISCSDCHHHPEDNEDNLACSECHVLPKDGTAPKVCADCHEPDDFEVEAIVKKSDAMHGQCIGCHKESDAGPQECAACHVSHSL